MFSTPLIKLLAGLRLSASQQRINRKFLPNFAGVSEGTYVKWAKAPHLAKAQAVHTLSLELDHGGFTFERHATPKNCYFVDVVQSLLTRFSLNKHTRQEFAALLGLSTNNARYYMKDADYAARNLTMEQLFKLADFVGFGSVEFHEMELPNGQHISESIFVEGEQIPDSAPIDDSPDTSYEAYIHTLRATVESKPTEYELYLPLVRMVRVLKHRRETLHLKPDSPSLKRLTSTISEPETTLLQWEGGKFLFHNRGSTTRDLTLGRLSEWGKALGFGQLVSPLLGGDFAWAVDVLLRTTEKAVQTSPEKVQRVLGAKYQATHWFQRLEKGDWQHMPAALYEWLSLWCYGGGLAFTKNPDTLAYRTDNRLTDPDFMDEVQRKAGERVFSRLEEGTLRLRERNAATGNWALLSLI